MAAHPTEAEEDTEQIHFSNVVATFRSYAKYSLAMNNRRRKDIYRIPNADQELLDRLGYKQKLDNIDKAILANGEFLGQIAANPEIFGHNIDFDEEGDGMFEGDGDTPHRPHSASHPHQHSHPPHPHSHGNDRAHEHLHITSKGALATRKYKPTESDMEKLRSTLKQFVRDWSEQGKVERDACYEPIKGALLQHFSHVAPEDRQSLRVLVPGAGLGRLAYDVACLGFACQGNEFSYYMLLASYFMLNKTDEIKKYTLYPYIHSFSNAQSRQVILQPISVPDVLPSAIPSGSNFSLVAGDFEELYGAELVDPSEPQAGQWDAVLTCFFIDTAKNIVNYLRIIHKILAPGGVWINLGPLLWHWENNATNDVSIELDLEEVKNLARDIGFDISNERAINTTYTNNAKGMLNYIYRAAFWTATKRNDASQ